MKSHEKPEARGPAPSRKAQIALGEKLNRKPKEPPTFPGKKPPAQPPPARRKTGD
jgi:hypothetical protein